MIADMDEMVNKKRRFVFCCNGLSLMWARGAMVALAGFGGMVLLPSLSLAQYPGSAGDLNTGAFGAPSSASSGSGSSSATSSASSSADSSADSSGGTSSYGSASSSASGSMASSNSSAGDADGGDGYEGSTAASLPPKKAVRKRALIRQFRLEFAKTLTIETANKLPLRALSADVYLDQFSKELDAGLEQQADVNSLGSDLGLLRKALDHRLDKVIASYDSDAPRRDFFYKTTSAGGSEPALRTEIQKLKLKHELLKFGEYSLQAMGYYAK